MAVIVGTGPRTCGGPRPSPPLLVGASISRSGSTACGPGPALDPRGAELPAVADGAGAPSLRSRLDAPARIGHSSRPRHAEELP